MEEINIVLEDAKEKMAKAVGHTVQELAKIRAGKAMPNMLDGLMVDYYGNDTPINQVASITTPDARTIAIKPWEKAMIQPIEKAIINSDLGLNPQNNGEQILINVPALTEDRRKHLVKQSKTETDNGKVSIRNVRKEMNDMLKTLQKDGASEDEIKKAEDRVQKLTDQYVAEVDELLKQKENDIMTI